MARQADTPCAVCGTLRYVGKGSLPEPTCRPCRRAAKAAEPKRPCAMCGDPIPPAHRAFCSMACRSERARELRVLSGRPVRPPRVRVGFGTRDPYTRRVWRDLRLVILERDGWRCHACDVDLKGPGVVATADHIVPSSQDPARFFDPTNLRAACLSCNSKEGQRIAMENRSRREPAQV